MEQLQPLRDWCSRCGRNRLALERIQSRTRRHSSSGQSQTRSRPSFGLGRDGSESSALGDTPFYAFFSRRVGVG